MSLSPKTIEQWAGLRQLTGKRSVLSDEIADLRADLSGVTAYQPFVSNDTSFSDLETGLKTRYSDVPEVSESDITGTVDILDSNFGWSSYSSGVQNQSTWDAYRTFLTNNGLTGIEADRHIQILQRTFDPDAAFAEDEDTFGSYADIDTYLQNHGFSSSAADVFVSKLKDTYASYSDLETKALNKDNPLAQILSATAHITDVGIEKAGIRIFEEAGTTADNVAVPAGSISARGQEVHFSELGAPGAEASGSDISYSGLNTDDSDNTVIIGTTVGVSATVSNSASTPATVTAPFIVDQQVTQTAVVTIPASGSQTVQFDFRRGESGTYDIQIGGTTATTITVRPPGV